MNKTRPGLVGRKGDWVNILDFIVAFRDFFGSVSSNNLGRYWRNIKVLVYKGFEHSVKELLSP